MSDGLATKYIVNVDVSLVDIKLIPEMQGAELPVEGTEVVIYRARARGACFALDRAGVTLVEQFHKGCTLVEALSDAAGHLAVPKDVFVKSAYPLLQKLLRDRFLIEQSRLDEFRAALSSKAYEEGDLFRGHRVVRKIQQFEDTAVFKVALVGGGYGALKVLRTSSDEDAKTFRREHAILTKLDGTIAPRVLDAQLEGDDIFILTEWIEGNSTLDWCAGIANLPHDQRHRELHRLTVNIISAFNELHRRDIIHSDVWPKNILVDRSGSVRILDFGGSRWPYSDEHFGIPPRINSEYFKAPDFARAQLEGTEPPPASIASDIYSLGVTLYRLIVGSQYLDFPLEAAEHNRSICTDDMLPFHSRGAHPWPEMEQLLAEMLRKDPQKRIATLADCLERVERLSLPESQVTPRGDRLNVDPIPFIRSYVGDAFEAPFVAPTASLFLGLGGLGYAFFRGAALFQDHELLLEAEFVAQKALEWMSNGSDGSFNASTFLAAGDVGRDSLLHHEEGLVMVQALVAHAMCDRVTLRAACLRLMSWDVTQDRPAEYMIGKAGILNAVRQVSYLVVENEELVSFGNEIAESILSQIEKDGEISRSPLTFLGFAHGWAGILHTLLSWSRAYSPQLFSRITPFLEQLNGLRIGTARGSYWPRVTTEPEGEEDLASWCNGTGGHILLWTEAYKANGNQRWLENAIDAGNHLARTVVKSFDLCCGAAGRALCLGHLYTITQDTTWLELARNMLSKPRVPPDTYIHSLFKGIPGLEVARAELLRPDSLIFPTIASDQYGCPLSVGRLSRPAKGS